MAATKAKLSPNLNAFLDTVAFAEIGPKLLKISDDGYRCCVGSTPVKPILFNDYSKHPRIRSEKMNSDAAGRYQFMGKFWLYYRDGLNLPDFGPESQDRWAIQLIRECKALDDIEVGKFPEAVHKCRSRWASFPGASYGQPEKSMAAMIDAYEKAGGTLK